MRKILFFEWNAFMQNDVERCLSNMPDIEVTYISYEFRDLDEDPYFRLRFPEKLLADSYDAVFSLNFFPVLSDICNQYHIKYISWVYDAPMNIRRVKSLANSCNIVNVFDRGQYNDLIARGYTTIRHLPLAVDNNRLEAMDISQEDLASYSSEISFVGKLYDSAYSELISPLPLVEQTKIEELIQQQLNVYGKYMISDYFTNEKVELIRSIYSASGIRLDIHREELEWAVASEVTRRERLKVLTELKSIGNVDLYSYNVPDGLNGINCKGTLKYYSQMPKVFRLSKINLNITLKIIKTGIPLRVFDILGAGGFLVSNYQTEIDEYFDNGKDLIMYSTMSELKDICRYYLDHEEERRTIAANGHIKVKQLFDMESQLRKIVEEIG